MSIYLAQLEQRLDRIDNATIALPDNARQWLQKPKYPERWAFWLESLINADNTGRVILSRLVSYNAMSERKRRQICQKFQQFKLARINRRKDVMELLL